MYGIIIRFRYFLFLCMCVCERVCVYIEVSGGGAWLGAFDIFYHFIIFFLKKKEKN